MLFSIKFNHNNQTQQKRESTSIKIQLVFDINNEKKEYYFFMQNTLESKVGGLIEYKFLCFN